MATVLIAEAPNPSPAAQLIVAIHRKLRSAPAAVATEILSATIPWS